MASALARYLLPSETCVAIVRRHWAVLIPQAAIVATTWIVWAVVLDASVPPFVQTIAAFFFLFSGAWMAWLLADWYVEQFVVTDKRVLLMTGLLYRRLAVMPLAKVTDLTYERSPLGRVLGYGTFIMESAGQDQALSRVDYLRSPDQLYQRLSEELFGPGGRDDGDGSPRGAHGPFQAPTPPVPPGHPRGPQNDAREPQPRSYPHAGSPPQDHPPQVDGGRASPTARPSTPWSAGASPYGTNSDGTNSDGTNSDGTNSDGTNSGGTPPDVSPRGGGGRGGTHPDNIHPDNIHPDGTDPSDTATQRYPSWPDPSAPTYHPTTRLPRVP